MQEAAGHVSGWECAAAGLAVQPYCGQACPVDVAWCPTGGAGERPVLPGCFPELEGPLRADPAAGTLVPMAAGPVRAGYPCVVSDDEVRDVDFNRMLAANPASTYVFRMRGDAMSGAGIRRGSLLVVDRSAEVKSGMIAVMRVGGAFTVRRFVEAGGRILLHPEDGTGILSDAELPEGGDWECFGVVKHVIGSF